MRRGDEDRLIEQILPVAGELLLGDDRRAHRIAGAVDKGHGIAQACRTGFAQRQGRQIELPQRLDKTKATLLVVSERVAGDDATILRCEPHLLSLGDEVPDGEDEALLGDHHAAAFAPRAKAGGSKGIVRDVGTDGDDRFHSGIDVHEVIPSVQARVSPRTATLLPTRYETPASAARMRDAASGHERVSAT